jgi:hypothetical protein
MAPGIRQGVTVRSENKAVVILFGRSHEEVFPMSDRAPRFETRPIMPGSNA